MINQDLKAATLPGKITQQAIAELQEFIVLRPDARDQFGAKKMGKALAWGLNPRLDKYMELLDMLYSLAHFFKQYRGEVRKALAVKLVYQGYLYEEIPTILDVSLGSITGWKQAYEKYGIDGLRLSHKGRKSYLSAEQREEVLSWLQTKECWSPSQA